ncbi:MAG: dicarboxylate/amino acid:cation symporter [Deltaproteobacteria bacterium]|nr:MAG: dicarboxylate/amino acid:cation symporter [Deltaproteobacteria bacterium]
MKFLKKLENQTLIAIIFGLLVGYFFPGASTYHSVLGDLFITLLKMVMIPLVLLTLFHSLLNLTKQQDIFKQLGFGIFVYYLATSVLASFNGLLMANIFSFGGSFETEKVSGLSSLAPKDIVLSFFSKNLFKSLVEGDLVPLIVFTITFAVFVGKSAKNKDRLIEIVDVLTDAIQKLTEFIIKFTPVGVFSLVAVLFNKLDFDKYSEMGSFFMATGIGMSIHAFIILPLILWVTTKFSPLRFFLQVREAVLVAFFSQSSSATMPVTMRVLEENAQVEEKVYGVSVPIGATLNMDGAAFYHAILIMFMASLSGIQLGFGEQIVLLLLTQVSSAGAAGIPNGGLMMMSMMLGIVGIPAEMIALYIIVDRFWDLPITAVNVWGDLIGAKVLDSKLKNSSDKAHI